MKDDEVCTLKWLIILGTAVYRIIPGKTVVSVLLSLTAQVAMLLSFILPLKIVMILGTQKIPLVLPNIIQSMKFESLILALSGFTLFFFLVQLASNKWIGKLSVNNANLILSKDKKLIMFEGQERITKEAYKKIVDASSSILFSLLGLTFLICFYPDYTVVFLCTIITMLTGISTLYRYNKLARKELSDHFPQAIQTPAHLSFLALFAYIVVDFLYLTPPNFLIAIAAVILSRQVINQIQATARSIYSLLKQKEKLSAIFLKEYRHNPQPQLATHSLWHFLSDKENKEWLSTKFASELNISPVNHQISWIELGTPNCATFILEYDGSRYLAKLFEQNKRSHAQHEAALLLSNIQGLPAPKLISTTVIDRFHCHILDLNDIEIKEKIDAKETEGLIKKELAYIEPTAELIEMYIRSRKTLPNRVTAKTLERLRVATTTKREVEEIDQVSTALGQITAIVDRLPLILVANSERQNKIGVTPNGKIILLHWPDWVLEPMGAYWPVSGNGFDAFLRKITLEENFINNTSLTETNLRLSALLSSIEKDIEKHKLKDALITLTNLLETYNVLSNQSSI